MRVKEGVVESRNYVCGLEAYSLDAEYVDVLLDRITFSWKKPYGRATFCGKKTSLVQFFTKSFWRKKKLNLVQGISFVSFRPMTKPWGPPSLPYKILLRRQFLVRSYKNASSFIFGNLCSSMT